MHSADQVLIGLVVLLRACLCCCTVCSGGEPIFLSSTISTTIPSVTSTMRDAPDKMAEKRDTAMIEDRDRDSVSLDKEALTTLHQIKPGMTAEDVDFLNNMPAREQARIYHKVDRRLVPMLALLYLIGMRIDWIL